MAKELNNSDLGSVAGGYGACITEKAFRALGLTSHDVYYRCDSYALDPSVKNDDDVRECCYYCLYGAEIDRDITKGIACLLNIQR